LFGESKGKGLFERHVRGRNLKNKIDIKMYV